ncbi:MAG6790 family protein [[Mycoplasma] mobile]|uniref:Expressed protein n=1 Tax=Mycoplasma mobile (strain ATCC 43663 / 163K / NCTC 11711) TaxID=267748 RepID=Q6KH57_MYCM1|nr:hypothetical protein [[Mycoplasma] mobile]AAT28074.1 expressed protein [Mycoplasma mobile 163K]
MYQYKAVLKSTQEIIAEGHTVEDIEHQIVAFRRAAKKGDHTRSNEQVQIIHVKRAQKEGANLAKEEVVKIV